MGVVVASEVTLTPTPQDTSELGMLVLPDPSDELAGEDPGDDGWGCLGLTQLDDFLKGRVEGHLKFGFEPLPAETQPMHQRTFSV